MNPIFFDPRSGELRELRPAAAPRVSAALGRPGAAREAAVFSALRDALGFLGLSVAAGREIVVSTRAPGAESAWLRPAPLEGGLPAPAELAARGFSSADADFFLRFAAHYRSPLVFSWDALSQARAQRQRLLSAAAAHAAVTLEPSARALAGYLHRFREALRRDLNFPEALSCVHDALRPGALSPGSRASLLKRVLPTTTSP